MRFMLLMIPKGYEQAAPGAMPDAEAVAAMMKYNESLQKAGVLLALEGLHPPSMGARVSFAGGRPRVSDGPFPEANEVLGGYWMLEVESKAEAIAWASRCPASDDEVIEIRQVQEFTEFPDDVQEAVAAFPELQEQFGQTRARREQGDTMSNKVTHFEVHGTDGKRLQQFYSALFGWKVDANNPMQYGLVSAEQSGIGGGIAQSPAAPKVTFYVEVADLAAALKKAGGLGGKTLMEPHQVPGGPRIAMFSDPDGNAIGLLEAGSA